MRFGRPVFNTRSPKNQPPTYYRSMPHRDPRSVPTVIGALSVGDTVRHMNDASQHRFKCVLCSRLAVVDYLYQKDTSVCDGCAGIVSNHWWKSHSGTWLTWPETKSVNITRRKALIPARERWAVFERDDFRCVTCGSRHSLEVDHIHPESRGGASTMDNYQTLCRSCNNRKGASLNNPETPQ